MAQPLLHHRKHLFVTPAFGIDDPVRRKTGQSKAGREEIGAAERPEHGSGPPRGDTGGEQGRRRIVAEAGAGTGYFVQRCSGEAAAFQPPVDCVELERHALPRRARTRGFDRPHLRAQGGETLASGW